MRSRGDAGYEPVIALRKQLYTANSGQLGEHHTLRSKDAHQHFDWPGAAVSVGSVLDDDDEMQVQTRSSRAPQPELSEYRTSY